MSVHEILLKVHRIQQRQAFLRFGDIEASARHLLRSLEVIVTLMLTGPRALFSRRFFVNPIILLEIQSYHSFRHTKCVCFRAYAFFALRK